MNEPNERAARAETHDRAAEIHESAANLHETHARSVAEAAPGWIARAHLLADAARFAADRERRRADAVRSG